MKITDLDDYVSNVIFLNDRFNEEESRVKDLPPFVIGLPERDLARFKNVETRKLTTAPRSRSIISRDIIVSKRDLPTIVIVKHNAGDWSVGLDNSKNYAVISENITSRVGAYLIAHMVADTMTAHRKAS